MQTPTLRPPRCAARKHHVERALHLRQFPVERQLLVELSSQARKERVDQRGQPERRCIDVCAIAGKGHKRLAVGAVFR